MVYYYRFRYLSRVILEKMNPGPSEEVGRVATSLIDNLKAHPLAMSMLVFNLFVLLAVYFISESTREQYQEIIKMLVAKCH